MASRDNSKGKVVSGAARARPARGRTRKPRGSGKQAGSAPSPARGLSADRDTQLIPPSQPLSSPDSRLHDTERAQLAGDPADLGRIRYGEHSDPHRLLGPHPARLQGRDGVVVRAYHPEAQSAWCLLRDGEAFGMQQTGDGLFAVFLAGRTLPVKYQLLLRLADGQLLERDDPYRFGPTITELDLRLFRDGEHRRLWEILGAHPRAVDGVAGTAFAVWAPNARRVSVVGDFCQWDGRLFPMRTLGGSGVWELFVPQVGPRARYKFEIRTPEFAVLLKTDPFAFAMELPPGQAARVNTTTYRWGDDEWMSERSQRNPSREPMAVYEVHLGSWARAGEKHDRWLSYRELAPRLVEHAARFGFTHLELLPIAEHALYESWGYEVTGHYAPTARYGTPDDFRYFVDYCHQHGIGVILDWVPGHFPKDHFALQRFDGAPLYEPEEQRRAGQTEWGTLPFGYRRPEVVNYLMANALYWLHEYHVDGLRVDAVASMLGHAYSSEEEGGVASSHERREHEEAADFLRTVNRAIAEEAPGALTIAEDSGSRSGATLPASEGGLGFAFKWNMGWMHDTLRHFSREPADRKHHPNELTFSMLYEHSEQFINSLSHDEVVHGKRSLLEKMPGNLEQKLANLRLLLAYQYTRPGKVLLFMGAELAQEREWNHKASVDWGLAHDQKRKQLQLFLSDLGRLYHERPALWRGDPDAEGFEWIECSDPAGAVLAYVRRERQDHVVVVLNLAAEPREGYRLGVPAAGKYYLRMSTDDPRYGGSGYRTPAVAETEPQSAHGRAQSIRLHLPALGALILVPE